MSSRKLNAVKMKQIAAWKSTHPEISVKDLAEVFDITPFQVRYSLQKYSDFSLMQNTKKGRQLVSNLISDVIDEESVIKSQMNTILSTLESDMDMAVSSRLNLMNQYLTLRTKVTNLTLQKHLKGIDAELVARIIRRFKPNATDEDVIKIFNEEMTILKS